MTLSLSNSVATSRLLLWPKELIHILVQQHRVGSCVEASFARPCRLSFHWPPFWHFSFVSSFQTTKHTARQTDGTAFHTQRPPPGRPPPPFHLRSTLPRPTPPGGPCCCHSAFPSGKSEWLFLEADISAIPAGDALPHARLVNGRDQCKAGTMSCLLARRCSRRS